MPAVVATASRCRRTAISIQLATIPTKAPSTIPPLKKPCIAGRIDLRNVFSRSAACMLAAISVAPIPAPIEKNPQNTTAATEKCAPSPMSTIPTTTIKLAIATTARDPRMPISLPDVVTPQRAPIDIPNITMPISAVEAESASRIAGVRDAQVATNTPGSAKITNRARRCRSNFCIANAALSWCFEVRACSRDNCSPTNEW